MRIFKASFFAAKIRSQNLDGCVWSGVARVLDGGGESGRRHRRPDRRDQPR